MSRRKSLTDEEIFAILYASSDVENLLSNEDDKESSTPSRFGAVDEPPVGLMFQPKNEIEELLISEGPPFTGELSPVFGTIVL